MANGKPLSYIETLGARAYMFMGYSARDVGNHYRGALITPDHSTLVPDPTVVKPAAIPDNSNPAGAYNLARPPGYRPSRKFTSPADLGTVDLDSPWAPATVVVDPSGSAVQTPAVHEEL